MNQNTNRWAYHSLNPRMAEAFQRIAFSFGYKWVSTGTDVRFTEAKFFAVDPESKELTWGNDEKSTERYVNQIVIGLDSAMELFINPPVNSVSIGSDVLVHKDGSIQTNGGRLSKDVVDEVIETRNKLMGVAKPKQKLPWVSFVYTSQNQGRKMRNILVVESGDGLIKGLDMDDDFSFKQYKTKKITGAVSFVGFEEEPS